jgi:hypothetical protein
LKWHYYSDMFFVPAIYARLTINLCSIALFNTVQSNLQQTCALRKKTFLSGPDIGASTVPHYLFQGRQSPGHITMFAVALAALTALAVQAAAQGQWNEGKICRLFLGDFPECMLCQTGRSN